MNKIQIIIVIFILFSSCKIKKNNISSEIQIKSKNEDSLAFELCQIYGLDQGIRNNFLWKSDLNLGKLQKTIDTLNFNRIVDFVMKNGYPTKKLLGESNFKIECVESTALAVLLHNPHRLVKEDVYFNLFVNEVKKGNLRASEYADILDKYYWAKSKNKKNRSVLYGSQFGKPCIQTKEITNKARKEIGLAPLKDDEFIDCNSNEELHVLIERK
jgi:hypothetical protein